MYESVGNYESDLELTGIIHVLLKADLLACTRLRRLVLRHCWTASPELFQHLRGSCLILRELAVDECDTSRSEPCSPIMESIQCS